jgi:alginate O-acetyltransferase complex protein AlgI
MIFNTFAYFLLFLFPAALAYRWVPAGGRSWVLASTGAAFYVYYSLTEVGGVVGAVCLLVLLWEAILSRLYKPGARACILGVAQALAVLFVFKYWNFVVGLVFGAGSRFRWDGQFLPLGISFFTFEFIHYAVDRRRGKTESGSLGEYLAFILFFPTMVAGPIKRFQDFLPSLRAAPADGAQDWSRGITRILTGLAKKFVVADLMTSMTANLNPAGVESAARWVLPIWLLAYAVQIYADFSAYSDIAIGSARLFGFRVKENFDWPYLRTNIAEFWKHWHISLTRWLTDYVFIGMGGSRVAPWRCYLNVLVTMLVSGLWHGAGLNFVVWGLWHGSALAVFRWWSGRPGWRPPETMSQKLVGWVLTMFVVLVGWAWFAMDLPTALLFFKRLILG